MSLTWSGDQLCQILCLYVKYSLEGVQTDTHKQEKILAVAYISGELLTTTGAQ